MCQICAVKQVANSERWPRPLESSKNDISFLVDTIHTDWETFSKSLRNAPVPEEMLELLRLLAESLEALELERSVWWKSPEKQALRKRLEDGGEQRKLSDLHKINNTTISSIESMRAKLGVFVKWSLGMKGMWELMNAHKVFTG